MYSMQPPPLLELRLIFELNLLKYKANISINLIKPPQTYCCYLEKNAELGNLENCHIRKLFPM